MFWDNLAVAVNFFVEIAVELIVLFIGITFLVGLIQGVCTRRDQKKALDGRHKVLGSILGAGFGALTPFCSCSTIPLLLGMLNAGVPFSAAMSFLFSSPLLNPVIISLFIVLMGWKVASLYFVVTFVAAITIGLYFALQPVQEMVNLNELCHLHWIDHHQTSLADPKDKGQAWMEGIKGIRSSEGAACELVWRYFWHHPETLVTYPMPNFVQWIGIYDRWDQSDMGLWENIVLPFQFGMKARETDPATDEGYECWRHILEIKDSEVLRSAVTSIILQGLAVKRYADKQLKNFINGHAFTSTWNGITWLVMNGGGINSAKETSAFDPAVHQGVLGYVNTKGNFWRVSMRTDRDDLDLSALARQFGGGGHRKAAGFQIKDLPAELVGPDYGEGDDGQPDEGIST